MRILISGSRGTIGSALVPALRSAGHRVTSLVRRAPRSAEDETQWNPTGPPNPALVAGYDAVIHLAAETIAGRWTASKKAEILNSRIQGTGMLAESIAQAAQPPSVFVSAAAIGYYGARGDDLITEETPNGAGWLPSVARDWEAATAPAAARGVRLVLPRMGVVLARHGGALSKMLPPFRLGLGGPIGSGRQWMSWVSIHDVVGAIIFALANDSLRGPVNVVSPHPVINAEFVRALGRVLHRPAVFPLPAFMVRLLMGEMGEELLLGSQRVLPARLQATGYTFQFPEVEGALRHILL